VAAGRITKLGGPRAGHLYFRLRGVRYGLHIPVVPYSSFYINYFFQVDDYGTQKSIALLKFIFESGGLYGRGKDLKWKNIKDIGMYMCYHGFLFLYHSILCSEFCVYLL